ncbi:MAG TPA: HAMP domain-containing sensor histidine kinase [Candidatus Methylomirabilis sp.]|nr:HAMP domain-containing sensor histidine kinase [Candidatus Methylomirabilis sp.]
MNIPKSELVASMVRAKGELDQALAVLEALPAFDPGTVGYAAHAINNYLTLSNVTLDLLGSALADHPDAEVHNLLAALRQAATLMVHTVNQLINASATGEPHLVFGSVNVVRLIRIGCDYYQTVAARKQILIVFASAVEAAYVWTDRVAVGAILDNLLSNAVKYSPPGKCIRVIVTEGPDHLVCQVQDEGPGLSEEDQAQLYRRGVRLSPQPTGGEASSGFGLAIAKDLIEELGGKLSCESFLGQGTRFSFSLPTGNR